ncbi:MAG: hypothetical protein ACK49R_06915 [Planctomycetota bacterium]
MEAEPEFRIPPRLLFASLGLILGVYLAVLLSQVLWTALVAAQFFPETAQAWGEKQLKPEDFAARSELLMPPLLVWVSTALTAATCFGLGILIARWSRFSPLGHTAFAAILVCVTYLQFAFDKPAELKWMALVGMLAFPVAILLGSHWMLRRMETEEPEANDHFTDGE